MDFYTGSPTRAGRDCAICHVDGSGDAEITLESVPDQLFLDGEFVPEMQYTISVRFSGETRGLSAAGNFNAFALEIIDGGGGSGGDFSRYAPADLALVDNGRVLVGRAFPGVDSWEFEWTAPDEATSYVDLHLSGVDGNGANLSQFIASDPYHDDVITIGMRLAQKSLDVPPLEIPNLGPASPRERDVGCSSHPWSKNGTPVPGNFVFLCVALFALGRVRRGA